MHDLWLIGIIRGVLALDVKGRLMRILLVEDDAMIGGGLRSSLTRSGAAVDWVRSGEDASVCLKGTAYAVVLLDLGLPDMSGLELLKSLRAQKNATAVLIVTARDDLFSRVKGLNLGADDYIVKPFEFDELMARIRAVIRRQSGAADSCIECGEVSLNLVTHEVSYRGQSQLLSAREFSLMRALSERGGLILSRSQLEEKIYAHGEEVESNAIDVLIFYIRKKFGHEMIRNIRGVGWTLPKAPR